MVGIGAKLAIFVAAGVALFGVSGLFNAATSPVYNQTSKAGVLLPNVKPAPPAKRMVRTIEPDKLTRLVKFRINGTRLDTTTLEPTTFGYTGKVVRDVPVIGKVSNTDKGASLLLLFDNSRSMIENSPPTRVNPRVLPPSDPGYSRLEAAKSLLSNLTGDWHVALATFPRLNPHPGWYEYRIDEPAMLYDFTEPNNVIPHLDELRGSENSGTPLYDGISMALGWIGREEGRTKIILCLTDGRDSTWMYGPPEGLREAVRASGAKLIIVALGTDPDVRILGMVADEVIQTLDSADLVTTFEKLRERIDTNVIAHDVTVELAKDGMAIPNGASIEFEYEVDNETKKVTVITK